MKILIASDHAGFNAKEKVKNYLSNKNYDLKDLGTDSTNSVDYPDYAFKLGEIVSNDLNSLGILICGTGIGMSIACNKVKGVRCAKVSTVDEARLSKEHNNANVIALSANIPFWKMKKIIKKFIETPFSNIDRHKKRVLKINNYGDKND